MTSTNIIDELNILLRYMFCNLEECIKNIKEKKGVVQLIKKCYNEPEKSIIVRGSYGSVNISTNPTEIAIMELENKTFKENDEKRKKKVKKLKEKNLEMKMKISTLQSTITKNSESQGNIAKENLIKKYNEEFKRFNQKKEEMIKENENLKSENKNKTEEINVISEENDQLIVENTRLAYEKNELLVQLVSKSEEFKKMINNFEVERCDLNMKVEKLESRITELEEEVKHLSEPTIGHGDTLESLNNSESSFN